MSKPTLFVLEQSPKSQFLVAIAQYFKLDIEVSTDLQNPLFVKSFPLGLTPAFVGEKGYKLTEVHAIYQYFVSLISQDVSNLVGKNAKEAAQVTRVFSLANDDVVYSGFPALFMILGKYPYNKKLVDEKLAKLTKITDALEARLTTNTFLATERITFGDISMAFCLAPFYATVLAQPFVKSHPQLYRWFKTVTAHPIFGGKMDKLEIPAQPLAYQPPKKEKKESAPKAAAPKAAPKEAAPAAEEAPKKPKHPLEALGKPSAPLDEWKRTYSNEDTREVAIPWFWKNQWNPEEWSMWKVDYKYNDELTLTFMSNNLVGGFFNRLSASTKYMFGCMVVYGENNNNGITGAFLVRGKDYAPAFDVAPDWESYSYAPLDPSKEEDKAFIDNMFAWDQPVVVNGEKREIADGKVLK